MKTRFKFIKRTALLVLFSTLICQPSSLRAQGSLTPPGPPGPTMKTLDQVEARTPVDATHTPGFLNTQFAIAQPGSYYLTGNITLTNNNSAIFIQTNDVTLNLNGFAIIGNLNGDGIDVSSLAGQNVVIRNGTLRDCSNGVAAANGQCEVDGVRVYGCLFAGLSLSDHCIVRNCTAVHNDNTGILVGTGCVVTDCLALSNSFGITGGSDCLVSGCNASGNYSTGVGLTDNCNVSKCVADFNGSDGFVVNTNGKICDCVANTNAALGIGANAGGIIKGCVASGNLNGITCGNNSVVTDNQASGNIDDGIGSSGGSRIDGNLTVGNNNGIFSFGSGDIIVRNISRGNSTANYPAPGTTVGPVQTPATATSPWANF